MKSHFNLILYFGRLKLAFSMIFLRRVISKKKKKKKIHFCSRKFNLSQNCNIFSVLIINLLLNNFFIIINNFLVIPVISYRRVEKESDELLSTVWSLVMVREPELPAREVKTFKYH